jgi:tetratricopeptide (TPR) repeat protein
MKALTMTRILQLIFFVMLCAASWSQSVGVRVQGTVKDNGKPIAGAEVIITNSDASATYKSKTDEDGVFEIQGVPTGTNYQLEVINSAGMKVFISSKQLAFNADGAEPVVVAIDTSDPGKTNLQGRLEKRRYTREEIEAMQAQMERAQAQNKLISQAIDAINAKDWQNAVPPLKQLIANDPGRYEFYQSLGEAQLNLAQYDDAIQSFEKGIEVANNNPSASADPANDPAKKKSRIAAMLVNEGNAFVRLRKTSEAIDAFTRATRIEPDYPVAQFNLCAMLFNAEKIDLALPACQKSISLQPERPDAYFIKARLLLARASRDKSSKDQSAAAAALKKYIDLAPEGPHVAEARELIKKISAAAPANPGTKK